MADPALALAGQLLLAALAGVLLNLTPCVLPAIPVKIRTILRESGGQLSHRAVAAAAFTGGALGFFLTVGALTATLHWTWGTIFQSSAVVALLVLVLVGFAFITYRDVAIPVPAFAYRLRGHRYVEPALSGALSALLAAPCAGPFLGGVLAYALTRSPGVIISIFAAIAIGLSLPYVIVLLRPSLLAHLPSGGLWAVRVRQGLAFVLLAAAVFFAQSLVPNGWGRILWFAWVAALLVWAIAAWIRAAGGRARFVAAVFAVFGVGLTATMVIPANSSGKGIEWTPYAAGHLGEASNQARAVLLEFTADWCINCKVLERTVYADPRTGNALRDGEVIALQVDLTQSDPELETLLARYGGAALPFAVVLDRGGNFVQRFTGLFRAEALVNALARAQQSSGASS